METISTVEGEEIIHSILQHISDDRELLEHFAEENELTPDQLINWIERVKVTANVVTL